MKTGNNDSLRFAESLKFLSDRTNYENFISIPYDEMRRDLARLRSFLDFLGAPDRSMTIVHIAGTKGKGSVSMLLEHLLRSQGKRTGMFTSPHLYSILERFKSNGISCSESEFVEILDDLRLRQAEFGAVHPETDFETTPFTFFEWTLLIALQLFARHRVEVAILEVGLGGRFDATNVCATDVSVITSISYDHLEQLGGTLTQIAGEKAGIIRSNVPVVSGIGSSQLFPQNPNVSKHRITASDVEDIRKVIRQTAQDRHAPLFQIDGISAETEKKIHLPLPGRHQQWNLEIVRRILDLLRIPITPEEINRTLGSFSLPARMEVVATAPTIIVDGAHNRASMAALVESLRIYSEQNCLDGRKTLLFAVSSGKDIEGMAAEFGNFFDETVVTTYSSCSRACPLIELTEQMSGLVSGKVVGTADFHRFLKDYQREHRGDSSICCATGSFYFASEVALAVRESSVNFDLNVSSQKLKESQR